MSMDSLTIYLLRHGESIANLENVFASRKIDPPLSSTGIVQVSRQVDSIKDIKFDAIYASPLLRAKQTAEIVCRLLGLKFKETENLYEVDVGILDGETQNDPKNWSLYEEVIRKWEEGLENTAFPAGESLMDIKIRFKYFLSELHKKDERHILIIGHCLLFMSIIWSFCEERGNTLEDGHMDRGHLSIITDKDGKLHLVKFNIPPGAAVVDKN